MTSPNDRTRATLDNIARGVEVGTAGLSLLERIIALFRIRTPEEKADDLRNKAKNKRADAAKAKRPAKRKRLTDRADKLEQRADKIDPPSPKDVASESETG